MLEGKLGDFSLPDIFQLITLTKKTGALNVHTGGMQGRILFRGGEICYAVADADADRVAIGARLVQQGLADEEQILSILEAKRAEGADGNLAQAVLKAAEVDEGALDAFIRGQIEDAVFDLMRLTEASFSFDASEDADAMVGLTVSTEHLVIEGGRRMGEWASIREHIPSSECVLVLSPGNGTGDQVALTAEQWRVLSLVDGRRTVSEIVDLSGKGEFATSTLLSGLVTDGLVEVSDPGQPTGALAQMVARRDRMRRIVELELGGSPAPAPSAPEPVVQEPPAPAPAQDVSEPTHEAEPEPDTEPEPEPEPEPEVRAEPQPVVEALDPQAAANVTDDAAGDGAEAPAPARPVAKVNGAHVDRTEVARELAALGLGDDAPARPVATVRAEGEEPASVEDQIRRLTRDEDVNKGLLLRLIDGVKGA